MNRPHLTPEQQQQAEDCDRLTDELLAGMQGLSVGVVLGACMNVIRTTATYLPHDLRQKLAERLREEFAADIAAMQDTPKHEPGSSFSGPH